MDFLIKFKAFFRGEEAFELKKALEEKRFYPRARCFIEARSLLLNRKELPVLITEVSITGIRLNTEKKMKRGDIIQLQAIRGEGIGENIEEAGSSVRMKVVWCKKKKTTKDYAVGLQYADNKKNLEDSWVAAFLKNYGVAVGFASMKRKKIRIPVDLSLSITVGLEFMKGAVKDIGIGGMLVEADKNINLKDRLKFRVGPYKHLQSLTCEGNIAHKRFMTSTKKWVYGVLFHTMSEKQSTLLCTYLSTLCIEAKE